MSQPEHLHAKGAANVTFPVNANCPAYLSSVNAGK